MAIFLKSRGFKDIKYDNMTVNQSTLCWSTRPDQTSIQFKLADLSKTCVLGFYAEKNASLLLQDPKEKAKKIVKRKNLLILHNQLTNQSFKKTQVFLKKENIMSLLLPGPMGNHMI